MKNDRIINIQKFYECLPADVPFVLMVLLAVVLVLVVAIVLVDCIAEVVVEVVCNALVAGISEVDVGVIVSIDVNFVLEDFVADVVVAAFVMIVQTMYSLFNGTNGYHP